MEIATSITRGEGYVMLTTPNQTIVIPSDEFMAVNDNSGVVSVKGTANRKTQYLIDESAYEA